MLILYSVEQLKWNKMTNCRSETFLISIFLVLFLSLNISAQNKPVLREGMTAPNFSLKDIHGKVFKLSTFKGKSPVVIYFYPKAGTPGCTKQACGIRDDIDEFTGKNIVVVGISSDSKKELVRFVRENKLNFPLLYDTQKKVISMYGVLRDDGKAKRVTFIIDKKGKIAKIIDVSDISTHAKEVIEIASQL